MRVNESGRSMIEMLGVLAIIGVLSVGGIAGYSKAMNKFKTNKIADNVSMIVANVKTLYAQQNTYTGLTNGTAVSMGVIPDELGTAYSDDTATLTNAFNGPVFINVSDSTASGDKKAFIIEFNNLSREACIALSTNDWGSGYSSGLIALQVNNSSQAASNSSATMKNTLSGVYIGNPGTACTGSTCATTTATPGGSSQAVPLNVVEAAKACSCNTGNNCSIAWKYY
ncbi:MAG: type 4 pilus major pilin [Pseudomonadota bacterium]|nr:type 4 pilus major pilin [Pseudomonadota bacterium]